LILGQASDSSAAPGQSSPPLLGEGLEHVLTRLRKPFKHSELSEQMDHCFQPDQLPFTAPFNVQIMMKLTY